MTNGELVKRIEALEREVNILKLKAEGVDKTDPKWWLATAGRFADDPTFDEAMRLGREYRESFRPVAKKRRAKAKRKKTPQKLAS